MRLLFGAGAGAVLKVMAANLELDKDRVLDPALNTLVRAMQALAPGATPPPRSGETGRGGLPDVLEKIAAAHVAQTEAEMEAYFKKVLLGWPKWKIQEEMEERERDGNCLFVGRGDPGPCGRGARVHGRLRQPGG